MKSVVLVASLFVSLTACDGGQKDQTKAVPIEAESEPPKEFKPSPLEKLLEGEVLAKALRDMGENVFNVYEVKGSCTGTMVLIDVPEQKSRDQVKLVTCKDGQAPRALPANTGPRPNAQGRRTLGAIDDAEGIRNAGHRRQAHRDRIRREGASAPFRSLSAAPRSK